MNNDVTYLCGHTNKAKTLCVCAHMRICDVVINAYNLLLQITFDADEKSSNG